MNQVESHPYFQQKALLSFCRENNIHFTAYSPLGSFDRPDGIKAVDEPKLLDDSTIVKNRQDPFFLPCTSTHQLGIAKRYFRYSKISQ